MACCLVGSLLMLAVASGGRWLRRHLLRQPEVRPEAWRLHDAG